jgi:hypothetical protein
MIIYYYQENSKLLYKHTMIALSINRFKKNFLNKIDIKKYYTKLFVLLYIESVSIFTY